MIYQKFLQPKVQTATGLGLLLCKEYIEKHGAKYGWRVKWEKVVRLHSLFRHNTLADIAGRRTEEAGHNGTTIL